MAKIDTSKIENYDSMTAEEKLAALENFEVEDNADVIESLKKDVEKYKNSNSKANSEAAEYKKQLREKMTEDEIKQKEAEEARKALEDEYNELKKKVSISENTSKFQEIGYDKADAEICAQAIVSGDLETFFATQKKHISSLKESIKSDLLKTTPTPKAGVSGTGKTVTRKELKDMSPTELLKFKNDNPDLYEQIMKGE